MDKFERIFRLHTILGNRRTPIARDELQGRLGCSRATLTRLIKECRDFFHSPIVFDRERQGYLLDKHADDAWQLPGMWFNAEEIHALLTSHRLLAEVRPGLLEPHINPLKERLEALLTHKRAGSREIFERIRILPMAQRAPHLEDFQAIADALVTRKRLRVLYSSRSRDEITERWVSPQRLVYYRDNWYLDAWCHLRQGLRTFSVDRLHAAEKAKAAVDVAEDKLNTHFTHSYGIFAGPATHTAVIRFSGRAATWVADEQWHPQQQVAHLPDGGIELTVPYGDPTELVRDILKHGADAEVIEPRALRELVTEKLSGALRKYRGMKKVQV